MIMMHLQELDLSDDQVEKLAAIKASTSDKVGPLMLKLHALERDYRNALLQPEISLDQANKIQAQLLAQKGAMDAAFSDGMLASAQVLSPEQRKQLKIKISRMELGPAFFHKKLEHSGEK